SDSFVAETEDIIFECRKRMANLVHADPSGVCFGLNGSDGLNLLIHGLLRPGDHVITTEFEHNSVLRPLEHLKSTGVDVSYVPCSEDGEVNGLDIEPFFNPNTRLVILTHASNVTGTITPLREIGARCREHEVLFCVDAAQSAGVIPIDLRRDRVDAIAFTGHKSLLGPTGTGGVVFNLDTEFWRELHPVHQGGTGTHSEVLTQPEDLPTKFEVGTPNVVGIAGLNAGLQFIENTSLGTIRDHEMQLTEQLLETLSGIPGLTIHGLKDPARQTAVVSVTSRLVSPADMGLALAENFNVITRDGLHCAPLAHKRMGTLPEGTLRFSMGWFNTPDQVAYVGDALGVVLQELA
ncbi:MAG TPA: aminotransferase class V-fold PLP-dependent enzyme, partial [Candidatus Lokiarchaeia archaeon]|nr:aminotransferase class V-fold PLP-dependent enzyme [Candidatus Lokiarchaeia archaeon]